MPHPPKGAGRLWEPQGEDLTASAEVNSACGEVWPAAKRSDGAKRRDAAASSGRAWTD